jgi:hypothetical protein
MEMSKMPEGGVTFQSPPKGSITYPKLDATLAKFVNRLTVYAEDLVFSRTASSGVAALVRKYRDYRAQL